MSEDEILQHTKGTYLCLIHPGVAGAAFREEIASVLGLAPSVPNELIASMITGLSWRERLLGLCIGMAKLPPGFALPMMQSLRDPRGISLVPTCAALAVLALRGDFNMPELSTAMFDRDAFDGELGWAIDKAMHFAGFRSEDVPGRGPNYGQVFEHHAEVYDFIYGNARKL